MKVNHKIKYISIANDIVIFTLSFAKNRTESELFKRVLYKNGGNVDSFLDLKKLNTFVKIAESGSFVKASLILGYLSAAVSIQIQQL